MKFLVCAWKPYVKNTLQGFLSLTMPSGMTIHDYTLHRKGDSQWIGLPAKQYKKEDGTTVWTAIIEFTTKEIRDKWQAAALEAVAEYLHGKM